MEALTKRLFQTLHGVFGKDHRRELVLRVRHPDGCTWTVGGDCLVLTARGADPVRFDLGENTIRTLVQAIDAAGFSVEWSNYDLWNRSALILLDGTGDDAVSNGDHIYGYTAVLTSHIDALGRSLKHAGAQIDPMLSQLLLPQAKGDWADLWGWYFGIPRWDGESDEDYTARIIEEVKRARNNPAAILRNIKRITGFDVEMREPWKEFHVLSESPLSGGDRMPGAPIWQYHTAQLIAHGPVDWDRVMAVANADRPAGTIYLGPDTQYPPFYVDAGIGDHDTAFIADIRYIEWVHYDGDARLSIDMTLSDYEIVPNHDMVWFDLSTYSNDEGLNGVTQMWPPITVGMGEIELSGGPPLGDVNARFSGFHAVEDGSPMILSDEGALSDYEHLLRTEPVECWFATEMLFAVEYGGGGDAHGTLLIENYGFFARRRNNLWRGEWDERQWVEPGALFVEMNPV